MFLGFYGLREQPFGVTPDPRFLYLSPTHREALASLYYGIESGCGFLALIAKPGMGKTTLLFHLLEKFRGQARTAFLFQTQCSSRDFMRSPGSTITLSSRTAFSSQCFRAGFPCGDRTAIKGFGWNPRFVMRPSSARKRHSIRPAGAIIRRCLRPLTDLCPGDSWPPLPVNLSPHSCTGRF